MEYLRAIMQRFDHAIATYLTRTGERARVSTGWAKDIHKAGGHVSGDAIAYWRFEGMPLPNIWEGK